VPALQTVARRGGAASRCDPCVPTAPSVPANQSRSPGGGGTGSASRRDAFSAATTRSGACSNGAGVPVDGSAASRAPLFSLRLAAAIVRRRRR